MKVLLGIPTIRPIKPQVVEALMNLRRPCEVDTFIDTKGYTPSEKRNYLIVKALNEKYDYLLLVDDDMILPPETLEVLLSRQKDIIGGIYYFRGFPPEKVIELFDKNIPNEPFICKSLGGGLILTKTSVFRKIKSPWFGTEVNNVGMTIVSEDYSFADKAREAGYEMWADPSLDIGHIGDYIYGKNHDSTMHK